MSFSGRMGSRLRDLSPPEYPGIFNHDLKVVAIGEVRTESSSIERTRL